MELEQTHSWLNPLSVKSKLLYTPHHRMIMSFLLRMKNQTISLWQTNGTLEVISLNNTLMEKSKHKEILKTDKKKQT